MLSDVAIKEEMKNGNIFIYPFNEKSLTGCGYNLSASYFIISTKKKMLETIYNHNGDVFVVIEPHDTILICTREYIGVSNKIGGTIHSRVKIVSSGFGHISTTLDPKWKGPLLIALNNPSDERLKFYIEKEGSKQSFATLVFNRVSPANYQHDNKPARLDVLNEYIASEPKWSWLKNKYSLFISIVKDMRRCMENDIMFFEDVESTITELENDHADLSEKIRRIQSLLCKNERNELLSNSLIKLLNDYMKDDPASDDHIIRIVNRCHCEKGELWISVLKLIEDQIEVYSQYKNGLYTDWKRFRFQLVFLILAFIIVAFQAIALLFSDGQTIDIITSVSTVVATLLVTAFALYKTALQKKR